MKRLISCLLLITSFTALAKAPKVVEGEYTGHYLNKPGKSCLVNVSNAYGDVTLAIHENNDVFSTYFEQPLESFKAIGKGSYQSIDPDWGDMLIFSFKKNSKSRLTEASVINQMIPSNTIQCVNLILK